MRIAEGFQRLLAWSLFYLGLGAYRLWELFGWNTEPLCDWLFVASWDVYPQHDRGPWSEP